MLYKLGCQTPHKMQSHIEGLCIWIPALLEMLMVILVTVASRTEILHLNSVENSFFSNNQRSVTVYKMVPSWKQGSHYPVLCVLLP